MLAIPRIYVAVLFALQSASSFREQVTENEVHSLSAGLIAVQQQSAFRSTYVFHFAKTDTLELGMNAAIEDLQSHRESTGLLIKNRPKIKLTRIFEHAAVAGENAGGHLMVSGASFQEVVNGDLVARYQVGNRGVNAGQIILMSRFDDETGRGNAHGLNSTLNPLKLFPGDFHILPGLAPSDSPFLGDFRVENRKDERQNWVTDFVKNGRQVTVTIQFSLIDGYPFVSMVKRVETTDDKSLVAVVLAEGPIDCGEGALPSHIRLVTGSEKSGFSVRDWRSTDMCFAEPEDAEFCISAPPETQIVGAKQAEDVFPDGLLCVSNDNEEVLAALDSRVEQISVPPSKKDPAIWNWLIPVNVIVIALMVLWICRRTRKQ